LGEQPNSVPAPDAAREQPASDAIGPGGQLRIGQLNGVTCKGCPIAVAGSCLVERLRNR
jgi:hypothetical protein